MTEATVGNLRNTTRDQPPEVSSLPPAWGFWATLGWVMAGCVFSAIGTVAFYIVWTRLSPGSNASSIDPLLVFYPAMVSVLAVAVRIARWPVHRYLALARPRPRQVVLGLACVALLGIADWIFTDVLGFGIEDYRRWVETYRNALNDGALPLFWLTTVIVGPMAEEIVFRGFLYRGWSHSILGISGTIALTSILFALMHLQYSWVGIFSCFCSGLLYGWVRHHSGTILIPMLLHFVDNLSATIFAAIEVHSS